MDKMELLLKKLYGKNYILDSYNSESLLRCLEDSIKSLDKNAEIELYSDMVLYSISHMEGLTESVHLFTLKLLKLAFDYQVQLIDKVNPKEFMINCLQTLKAESTSVQLHLSTINLMSSLIPHRLGVNWIIDNKVWEHMLHKHIYRRSKKVAEASYQFISNLVWKLDENDDEKVLNEVLDFFIKPIAHNEYLNVDTLDSDGELVIVDAMIPFIQTLLTVLRDLDHQPKVNRAMSLLTKQYLVEYHICNIGDLTKNQDLLIIITEIAYRIWCYALQPSPNKKNAKIKPFELMTLQNNFIYNIIFSKKPRFVVDSLMTMNLLWLKMYKGNMSGEYEWNGKQYDLEVQQISLVLTPLFTYVQLIDTDFGIRYKLQNILSEHTIKLAYACREHIKSHYNIKKVMIYSMKAYTNLIDHITDAQAGIMYGALHYVLENYGQKYNDNNYERGNETELEGLENSLEDVQILKLSLDLIKSLLIKHDINWYENVEIISLQNILINLLKLNDLATKQIIQTLEVIKICVCKFLLPDLSLLIENKNGSVLQELGQLMASLIHHDDWEIRDSTLSLLLICIEISFVKYAPMKKIILDNNLMTPMVDLSLADEEMYVQANALKCLAATTTMESLWNSILKEHPHLVKKIIEILLNHPESSVRMEAANVLINIYIHQQVTECFNLKMYRLMAKVALEDLQWEVQIAALNFWNHMIQNELNSKGMIDGIFPSVTFSKEKRKIVFLNDKEIQKQLSSVMKKLSSSGGLNVLHKCMNEEHTVQVREKANEIAKQLVTILKKYHFQIDDDDQDARLGYEPENTSVIHETNVIHDIPENIQDQVIDDILSKNLSELAIDLHNRNTDNDQVDAKAQHFQQHVMSVTDFLREFQKTNALPFLESEQNVNSENYKLNSLIEHILYCSVENYSSECD